MIEMRTFGSSLVTRGAGRAAYEAIAHVMGTEDIVFDFDGVDTITNSFADEVFGRLAYELGMDTLRKRTRFVNIAPFWSKVVRNAIDTRIAQRAVLA